jgi:hypothetical protein
MIVAELTVVNKDTKIQDVPGVDSNTLKVAVEKSKETGKPVSIAEDNLTEMAKIAGDLATAIKNVIDDNPELTGLDLKKAIKSDPDVIDALDGESLFDNQLTRFISLSKGERELGQRGRKVDLGNTLAKKMAELEAQEQSLMNKLNKIAQLKKELESSLGMNKVDESQVNEMAKIAGDLASAIKSVVNSNSGLEGLALKKAIKADASVKSALAGDELYDNQLNKYIALLKGERELGQRGRKADPNVAAKRSEEEKAKEEKRAEKDAKRAEKERAKAPAQKPTFPTYKKTTTMVDMSGEPSDKDEPSDEDIPKTDKELKKLGIDTPKPVKKVKLSDDEEAKINRIINGINKKLEKRELGKATKEDMKVLVDISKNPDIKKLFTKAEKYSDLKKLLSNAIGIGDTGADLIPDELT